jgi:hypothetical protein
MRAREIGEERPQDREAFDQACKAARVRYAVPQRLTRSAGVARETGYGDHCLVMRGRVSDLIVPESDRSTSASRLLEGTR